MKKDGEVMIKFGNVSKIYPNGTKGLTDVNLQINQGEFVAIIGTSSRKINSDSLC